MENIKTKINENINIFENSIIYLKNRLLNFDINKFNLIIDKNIDFEIKYAFSLDMVNWSFPVLKEEWNFEYSNITQLNDLYISIWCKKINLDSNNETTLYFENNINDTNTNELIINKITYDNNIIEFCENNIYINTLNKIVNTNNKWNFYDNQQANIRRWLDSCISVINMYGHKAIYFKTEVIESNKTLSNNYLRNVANVKKIPVISPDNDLPQDRNIYSQWDMPMEGEFVIHVVDEIFKLAFGNDKIPLSKDYLFLPIINKLFRVSSVQPVNGFMGKIGWWEVFLTKYEEDETITISNELKDVYSGIDEFEESFKIFDELDEILDNNLIDSEFIDEKTISEKKEVTNNFSNKLVDSTSYIDLKETELQREFYAKKLSIVSINPDNNAFPVTMYNCSDVEKRIVALTYNLIDLTEKSKNKLIVDNFLFSTNFVLLQKFSGELFDIVGQNSLSLFTLNFNRKKLSLILSTYQKTYDINYEFIENEFYQILVNYNHSIKQISINIFMLSNKTKNLVYQNIYIINSQNSNKFEFNNILVFGGKYLINEVIMEINNKNIIKDNVSPVLIMNKTGR